VRKFKSLLESLYQAGCARIYFPWKRRGFFLLEIVIKYAVVIEESDEGFAVSVPGLPGCHSQGTTEAEALVNIADAIRGYLEAAQELARSAGAKQATVEV
jgi:predicted RNase H-like HicB family nuclease